MIPAFISVGLSFLVTTTLSAPVDVRPIPPRLFTKDTYNQLTDGTPCRPISLIYARGLNEPGNIGGSGDLGPRFLDELAVFIGSNFTDEVAVQGVRYSANYIDLLLGGDPRGSTVMKNLVDSTAARCPKTKIVLAGYSTGAQLVHNAAQELSKAVAARVVSIAVWGDPSSDQDIGHVSIDTFFSVCVDKDYVCDGKFIVTPQHRQYLDPWAWAGARSVYNSVYYPIPPQ